jgi:hypothetical protein
MVGTASYRPMWSWRLDVTSPEGHQITPVAGSVLLRIAEQQLAEAGPAEKHQAQWRVDFIAHQFSEVIYDLVCRRGHHTLMTEPQITRALRQAQGNWVFLKETPH